MLGRDGIESHVLPRARAARLADVCLPPLHGYAGSREAPTRARTGRRARLRAVSTACVRRFGTSSLERVSRSGRCSRASSAGTKWYDCLPRVCLRALHVCFRGFVGIAITSLPRLGLRKFFRPRHMRARVLPGFCDHFTAGTAAPCGECFFCVEHTTRHAPTYSQAPYALGALHVPLTGDCAVLRHA